MTENDDLKSKAKSLYWMGRDIKKIAVALGLSANTLYTWRRRGKWDDARPIEKAHDRTLIRYLRLADREPDEITPRDYKIMDFYSRQLSRFERAMAQGEEREKKKKGPKNHFTEEQIATLKAAVLDSLYEHQRRWYKNRHKRNRAILKSRQIGASWYFAREALLDALESGRNQIFLSASRNQAFQFKKFIQKLAREICGVELSGGNEIILSNGATIYFLGTSAATAQSYTGNLFFDEFFWTSNFLELRKVAAGMATQKGFTRTYFSTPSSEEHQAYDFWTGDFFNKSRKRADRVSIDVSHHALKAGALCGDNMWRQIVTIYDTLESGFDLVDLEEIEAENPPEDFQNLYACEFVKRGQRAFDYNAMIACGVDGIDDWGDWHPEGGRPMGDREVWLGYDPNGESGLGDSAGLSVVVPPAVTGGKFRVIETMQLRGLPFEKQAEVIQKFTERYNVTHIGIDGTGGYGEAVYQIVRNFFPAAVLLTFNAALKRSLVFKAQMIIRNGRFEYDAGLMDLVSAFMTVRKVVTPNSNVVTYESDRKKGSNHGDLAWATMLALYNEPIGAETATEGFVMEY